MLVEQVLELLRGIKSNIVVDTGDGIKGVDAITSTEDGKGFIFVLEQEQEDEVT